jgi:ribosomal protein L40E
MQCPQCSAEVSDGAVFCRECGAALNAAPQQSSCPSCGETLNPGASFCRECGAAVGDQEPEPAVAAATGPAGGRSFTSPAVLGAIGVGVLVLGAAIVAAILLAGGGGDDEPAGAGDQVADSDLIDDEPFEFAYDPDSVEVPEQIDVELTDDQRADLLALIESTPLEGDTEAEQLIYIFGPPDQFQLSYETYDGSVHRYEVWYYYDIGIAYELLDTRVVLYYPIDDPEGLFLGANRYSPLDFSEDMTLDDVRAMLDDAASLVEEPIDEEFGIDASFWVGEQLLVAFDTGGNFFLAETYLLDMSDGSQ